MDVAEVIIGRTGFGDSFREIAVDNSFSLDRYFGKDMNDGMIPRVPRLATKWQAKPRKTNDTVNAIRASRREVVASKKKDKEEVENSHERTSLGYQSRLSCNHRSPPTSQEGNGKTLSFLLTWHTTSRAERNGSVERQDKEYQLVMAAVNFALPRPKRYTGRRTDGWTFTYDTTRKSDLFDPLAMGKRLYYLLRPPSPHLRKFASTYCGVDTVHLNGDSFGANSLPTTACVKSKMLVFM
ncbi:hypothetical protein WN51_14186 [Melipona quadrifasciata]|uniref:Uncharacterized protein n=1 Tax=Melipona quadrifasciata TaxID=166423 RepID=A0A0M9A0W6_9HYME|nr:hypothetical protein WN51_14186 [Melipona quadrifasciata]